MAIDPDPAAMAHLCAGDALRIECPDFVAGFPSLESGPIFGKSGLGRVIVGRQFACEKLLSAICIPEFQRGRIGKTNPLCPEAIDINTYAQKIIGAQGLGTEVRERRSVAGRIGEYVNKSLFSSRYIWCSGPI